MKCIHCGSDTTYKQRMGLTKRCAACAHPFAFEPKTDHLKMSDGLFQRAIRDATSDGTLFCTERQLWHEFNRRVGRDKNELNAGTLVASCAAICGAAAFGITLSPVAAIAGASGLIAGVAMHYALKRPWSIPFHDFYHDYLSRWIATHGPIDKLMPPYKPSAAKPVAELAPDLMAYSFDRALVTDSSEIAAMLVANNFHFENNCAVLSSAHYPEGVFTTVMTMLRQNPALKVFAVHSASVAGCQLPNALRHEKWFPQSSIQVINLGLRPKHVLKTKLLPQREQAQQVPEQIRPGLSEVEIKWLEKGNFVELATLRPAKLMRAIYQGFARSNQMGDIPDGDSGGGIWIYDSGADIHAADSFG